MNNFDDLNVSYPARGIAMGLLISLPLWAIIIGVWYWVIH